MDESQKTSQPIRDVAYPGDSAPSQTSRPIIVSNRPILKDPMMLDGEQKVEDLPLSNQEVAKKTPPTTESQAEKKIEEIKPEPMVTKVEEGKSVTPSQPKEPEVEKPKEEQPSKDFDNGEDSNKAVDPSAEAKKAEEVAVRDKAVQKLVDSKQYLLPINATRERRTHRVVIIGIVLSAVLALVWIDIALDAGLMHLGGLKAVTHFFSS